MAALSSSAQSFRFLYIPSDERAPLEPRTLAFAPEDEVGCLTKTLQPHFAASAGATRSDAERRATMRAQLAAEAAKKGYQLDEAQQEMMLERMAGCQMVDVVPMNLATPENDWTVVSVYCDDSAVAKGLPLNIRATKLSVACGKPMRIMGDAFVARAQDDNRDLYHRLDFGLEDFAPNASWVLRAKKQNDAKAVQRGVEELEAQQAQSAGSSSSGDISQKIRNVSSQKLEAYKADLEKWVQSKLDKYDADGVFRASRDTKYENRSGYEAFLRGKVEKKLATFSTK